MSNDKLKPETVELVKSSYQVTKAEEEQSSSGSLQGGDR